ncbi:MAG: hypothetical protein JW751_26595 [Polyangiaceae bacterium]|nr:hypothetical protein [Polyangiaceae bacterium]
MSGRVLTVRVVGVAAAAALAIGIAIALRPTPDPPARPGVSGSREVSKAVAERSVDGRHDGGEPVATGRLAEGSGPPFGSEDDYLRELTRLNRTDKRRALDLVRQGEQWYSARGVRAEARQAMGITLLVDVGEMEEARTWTRRSIATHPTSSYRPLVQRGDRDPPAAERSRRKIVGAGERLDATNPPGPVTSGAPGAPGTPSPRHSRVTTLLTSRSRAERTSAAPRRL